MKNLIYPMFAMVLLTFTVGSIAIYTRIKAVKSGHAHPNSFKLMNADNYPDKVIKTTRNFNNLFEVPLLFYAACLAFIALKIESQASIFLAWAFVGLRFVYSYIHISYNHLLHRIVAFWSSFLIVGILWVCLLVQAL